jgi:hypothetical protein
MVTVLPRLSNREYHAHVALGSTSLKALATKPPALWKYERDNPPAPSDVLDLGTIAHSLILEQDESGVEVIDVAEKRGKVWTEPADAARAAGKIPLKRAEWRQVVAMRDAVMADPRGRAAFTGHEPEKSIIWDEDGLMLKCRPDALHPHVIVDLKTARSADPRDFPRVAFDFGYFQSAPHYQEGVRLATGEVLPFLLLLVEKTPPHLLSVVEFDADALEYGRRMNDRAKQIYRECTAADYWPGYPDTEPLGLPRWAEYKLEETLDDVY